MKLELAHTLDSVAEIHAAIAAYCRDHEVADAAVFAVQLAVEELFTNLTQQADRTKKASLPQFDSPASASRP